MCAFMQVLECRLVVDPQTRESRGFGFVTMSSTKEADRCIKYLHRSTLEGRVITVEKVSGTIWVMLVNWCCLHDFLPQKPVLLYFLSSTKVLIKFQWSLGHLGKGSALCLVCKPRIPLHYIVRKNKVMQCTMVLLICCLPDLVAVTHWQDTGTRLFELSSCFPRSS
jgi:hypothetical protein